jgi:putative transcriptional regulator
MQTPLKTIRKKRGLKLKDVSAAVETDTGNLSRIENGVQTASKDLAEKLAKYFGHEVTEMQIIYPERYVSLIEAEDRVTQ